LVVQDLDRWSEDPDRLTVGTVGKIKTPQAIVRGGEAEPGFGIARVGLDRAPEVLLGQTVVIRPEILLPETQVVIWIAAQQTLCRFWRQSWGGRDGTRRVIRRRLRFHCCAIGIRLGRSAIFGCRTGK